MRKHICILASVENVEAVRERGKLLPDFANDKALMRIPVSGNGQLPATHFLCAVNYSERLHKALLAVRQLSEIEVAEPSEFLKQRNLEIIKDALINTQFRKQEV